MLQKDLQTLGFTKNLSTIYLVLFELGEAKAGEIVRKTGMHRNIVYRALEELEEKKLVSKSQVRGVARYTALDPTRIMGEVESKQRLAEQIIDELKTKHNVVSQEIVLYEGKEEVRRKYVEVVSLAIKSEFWYYLGLSAKFFEINGEKIVDQLIQMQVDNNLHMKGVSGYIDRREGDFVDRTLGLTEYKFIPGIAKKIVKFVF